MTKYSNMAKKGPSVDFDGKKFTKVICFIGKDSSYSVAAIKILLLKKIHVEAIVGEEAERIWGEIPKDLKTYEIKLIAAKRPWELNEFNYIKKSNQMIGINCGFSYIIPRDILSLVPTLNIHPAALPFNRGCHHSFWGIIDATKLGATLHWMTEGLDEGPIIAQKTFSDDGYSSAEKIQEESNLMCLQLLSEYIGLVMNGKTKSIPQESGTYHSKKDILTKSTLNTEDSISVDHLFNLCRATNNKKNGFFIIKNNKKFRVVLDKIEEIKNI
jgi:methionyl-tRNA formyltransferase